MAVAMLSNQPIVKVFANSAAVLLLSNEKAKHELKFQPRPLEWLHPGQLGP
jgi:hypothetical protein